MLKSMTGFGRSELKFAHGHVRVEIKTVNHKFLEVSARTPGHAADFEERARKIISQELRRGKVNLFISCPDPAVFSTRLFLNEPLAKEAFHKIERLRKALGMGGKGRSSAEEQGIILREVLRVPDVLTKDTSSFRETSLFRELEKALGSAVGALRKSRIAEGRALSRDFEARLREIKNSVKGVEKRLPVLAREYRKSLESRMKDFLKNGQVDRERLTQEVAIYLKSSDISEEITRLKSHLVAMGKALGESGEVGRKIDFLGQEMLREANTMGSKSADVAIANAVIQIKSSIEKIREQAQNVE